MYRLRNTENNVDSRATSRRRFVSLVGWIAAGLAFASRARAQGAESPSSPQNPAALDEARKRSNASEEGNQRRYGFAKDRSALSMKAVPAEGVFVEEVAANYVYDAGSKVAPDGWVVVGSVAGGAYVLKGTALTLPIAGGGADDWPNFSAAANACAASGITLQLGPGIYTCNTGGLSMPSNLHVVCNPLTRIVCNIRSRADNADAPFVAGGLDVPISSQMETGKLASDTNIGDMKVVVSDAATLSRGDFVIIGILQFRTAMYEVLAFDPVTNTVSLDRPLRLPFGSPTAITSFPAGSIVYKSSPIRNVHVEFNGAHIHGHCARFVEIYSAWKCRFDGPVYCGDGTAITATERIISLDASCYDCHASNIYGDGGDVTSLGISFESAEASTFEYCDMRNMRDAGLIFQDGVDCIAIECKCNNNRGDGAIFTAAATGGGSVFGSDHCKIVGGSYSGNGQAGIVLERGSSRCVVDGAQVLSNPGGGIVDRLGNDNLIMGKTVVRRNFTGVKAEATSVRLSAVSLQATDQTNGIVIETGAQTGALTGANANFNSKALIVNGRATSLAQWPRQE